MHLSSLLAALALSSVSAVAVTIVSTASTRCATDTVASTSFIGASQNVKLTLSHCDDEPLIDANGNLVSSATSKRQDGSNVCGAECDTYCWAATSGAANATDCTVIADALLYEVQNTGALFNVSAFGTDTNKVTMEYGSCLTYFLNQDFNSLTYCRSDWHMHVKCFAYLYAQSTLVNLLSSDCSETNGANGGLCVASDQRWYIQLQHS